MQVPLPSFLLSIVCVSKPCHSLCVCTRACKFIWELTPESRSERQMGSEPERVGQTCKATAPCGQCSVSGNLQGVLEIAPPSVCQGGQKAYLFLPRHPSLIVYHSLSDLLLSGPEAKLSGCTDVNYSRLLLISYVSYSLWNRDKKPQPAWSLEKEPRRRRQEAFQGLSV